MKKVKVISQSGLVLINEREIGFDYGFDYNFNRLFYVSGTGKSLPITESQVVALEFEDGAKITADINFNLSKTIANVTLINQNGEEFARTSFGTDNQDGASLSFAIWPSEKDEHNFVLEEEKELHEQRRKGYVNRFSVTQKAFDYNGRELANHSFSATSRKKRNDKAYASREKLFNMACEQEG